jgi:hypothetical protein
MANFLGKNAKAYVGTTVTTAATETGWETALAAATIADKVKDLKTNLQKDTAEISDRSNAAGFKTKVATLKDGTITFSMNWDPSSSVFTTLQNAYYNDTEIFFAALDRAFATTGAEGTAGNFQVSNFTRDEPLLGALTVDVELIPSTFVGHYKQTT